jgi:hypothetical protein
MPFDLQDFSLADTLRCGIALRSHAASAESVEEAAQSLTRYLYDELRDAATGARSCALVRCYKTHSYHDLPTDLQGFARNVLGRKPASVTTKCLTLLGTAGDRPEWNSRMRSLGHQAIPLESEKMVEQAPMIAQLIRAFGLDLSSVIAPNPEILRRMDGKSYSVFYVAKAAGSPYIPAQTEFVAREEIESVLGFGGMLRTGDLIAIILFSRVPISEETASRFRTLALDVRASLFASGEIPTFRSQRR